MGPSSVASKFSNRRMWIAIGAFILLWSVAMFYRMEIRAYWWAYRLAHATSIQDRIYYFSCLASIGDSMTGAVGSLLKNPSVDVRRQGAALLLRCRNDPAKALLLQAIHDTDREVRESAALGLALHYDQAALPELLRLVQSDDESAALAAVVALERIGGDEAAEALTQIVRGPSSPQMIAQAVDSLGLLGWRPSVPVLIDRLADDRPLTTRPVADRKAQQAIQHVQGELMRKLGVDPAAIDTSTKEFISDLAARALQRITGESFGFCSSDPPERRDAVIRLYRQWWEGHR